MTVGYLLIILVFGLGLFWWINRSPRRRISPQDQAIIITKLQENEKLTEQDRGKEAVFEADKLLDFVFKLIHLRGETFADRLKAAKNLLPNYQAVWDAHKLRNNLAHELDFQPSSKEVKQSLDTFDRAIRKISRY